MNKVMMTIRAPHGVPTIQAIRDRYQLGPEDIDEAFGVIAVDPDRHEYTILVDENATAKIGSDGEWEVSGPYSNPRIDTFGPPQ